MKSFFLHIMVIISLASALSASEKEVEVLADKESYHVGDIIRLKMELEGEGWKMETPEKKLLKPFELTGTELIYSEENLTSSFIVKGRIFETGEFTLPPFIFKKGEGESLLSRPALIPVTPVREEGDENLKPMKAQMTVSEKGPLWPWVLLVLLLILLAAAFYFFKKRKMAPPETPPPPEILPEEEALSALDSIEAMNLIREGQIKRLYTLVADVIRRYEGRIYGFDAMEMTTGEISQALRQRGCPADRELETFLYVCDRVKFAKYEPPDMDRDALIEKARNIVRKQIVRPETEASIAL